MLSLAIKPTHLHTKRVLCNHTQRLQRPTARVCTAQATKVQVVETSLGLGVDSKLLRHLGLRFNCDSDEINVEGQDFSEAHFGPGSGAFREGFLNTGKGMVASSEYKEVVNAGALSYHIRYCLLLLLFGYLLAVVVVIPVMTIVAMMAARGADPCRHLSARCTTTVHACASALVALPCWGWTCCQQHSRCS
jgi:hypothetical protein